MSRARARARCSLLQFLTPAPDVYNVRRVTASPIAERRRDARRPRAIALYCLLLLATILRSFNFPSPYEQRDSDETGYVQSSMAVFEGMLPPFKAAPAGPQIWIGWSYLAARAAMYTVFPTEDERAASRAFRPYVAINHAVFDAYRAPGGIRTFEIVIICALSILAVAGAFRIGEFFGGVSGAVFAGGLVACLPMFVDLSTQSRPYSLAWSFGIFAMCLAVVRAPQGKWVAAAVCLGLAVASRVEMVCLIPFVLVQIGAATAPAKRRRTVIRAAALAITVACAVAPWFALGFFGNLRSIVSVRFIGASDAKPTILQTVLDVAWTQGLLIAVVVFAFALVRSRRNWLLILTLLLLLTVLRPTGYGLHHQGPAIVALCLFASIGFAWIENRSSRASLAIALAAIVIPLVQSARLIRENRARYVAADPTGWIERNVPPGTTVYWSSAFDRLPLPTPASSDAIWAELTDVHAWQKKLTWGAGRLNVESNQLPRALSEDLMEKDRGRYRCWFILGSRANVNAPRYDVHVWRDSPLFGEQRTPDQLRNERAMFVVRGEAITEFGEPVMRWSSSDGKTGVMIYDRSK